MLLNDLYTIQTKEARGKNTISANVSINAKHDIFKGHFPQNPIVPGVCMLQMIKDLLEVELKKTLQLHLAANIKFIAVVDPTQHSELTASITYEHIDEHTYRVNAQLSGMEVIFMKIINAVYYTTDKAHKTG